MGDIGLYFHGRTRPIRRLARFHARAAGFRAMLAVYLPALFIVQTDNGFMFDLTGLLKLTFGIGIDGFFFAINFAAIILLYFAAKNLRALNAKTVAAPSAEAKTEAETAETKAE